MKIPGKRRQLRQGITYIELIFAALLLSIGLMGLVNVWVFSFRVTVNTDNKAIAYNLGRQAMENVKMAGFTYAAEGTTTLYYDGNQTQVSHDSSAVRFSVSTSVVSDKMQSGSSGQAGGVPAPDAIRTVSVSSTLMENSQVLYQTYTYLVKSGI